MARMIDLIRRSALPANLVQAAARGALVLPPEEIIEILVYLADHNRVFGQQARMTLAGWDEKASRAAAANPNTPQEVLQYMISPDNLRPVLLPALLENPSVPEDALILLASTGSSEVVESMTKSPRVKSSPAISRALAQNPRAATLAALTAFAEAEPQTVENNLPASSPAAVVAETPAAEVSDASSAELAESEPEDVLDAEITAFLTEHAAEIAAEGDRPFQPIGNVFDELPLEAYEPGEPNRAEAEKASPASKISEIKIAPKAVHPPGADRRRGGALQKIAKLDIKGRIQLAMKGTKEERSILIRDGTKIVALAVLESPKITDGEVEGFASQKNVLEAVLRAIPMKRRFAKHYPVIRNLVSNPRTPLDLSLGLMKNLLVNDLKNLSSNKEISETVRKLALKMYKQKSETSAKKKSE
jgi:hypothetical protein